MELTYCIKTDKIWLNMECVALICEKKPYFSKETGQPLILYVSVLCLALN